LIDVGGTLCDGFGIRTAALECTATALCLRQQGVDAICQRDFFGIARSRSRGDAGKHGKNNDCDERGDHGQ
jgi:hypothetical protein